MTSFSLRRASESDRDLIFEAFKRSMREYVEWAWGWDEEFQRNGFLTSLAVKKFQLVCVAGQAVGALYVEEHDQYHWIRTIFIRPEHQGQGIGSKLLTQEIERARINGKHVIVKVIKINPAKCLYERLGFDIVNEDDATYHMQLV